MIELSPAAEQQLDALRTYYEGKERPEAITAMIGAVNRAALRIARDPGGGLLAPRPYPHLVRDGRRWIKEGRYWFAYSLVIPVILAVFFDQADMPGRGA